MAREGRDDFDDERPKRSWREIDRNKDKGSHGPREARPGEGRAPRGQRSQAYRAYKSQLNKMFDGGGLPDALKSKLEGDDLGKQSKKRKALAQALLDASQPTAIRSALKAYTEEAGFPTSEDLLAKVLDSDDEGIVLEAMATLETLLEQGALKRAASLKARIKTAQMTLDDPRVQSAARELLVKL